MTDDRTEPQADVQALLAPLLKGRTVDESDVQALIAAVAAHRHSTLAAALRPQRRHRRRPRRQQARTLRVRVDLVGAKPPIWRRLALSSHLDLAQVHEVLQLSFGWYDGHLHRFAAGGSVWDPATEPFLCAYDVAEREEGLPEEDVRLDEVLAEVGDVLGYVYDYGDDWELRMRVENVSPASHEEAAARCLGGRRAAPPEDSGGVPGYEAMVRAVSDPQHPAHEEMSEWLVGLCGEESWDAAAFDPTELDEDLREAFPQPA